MPKLNLVTGKQMIKILESLGFSVIRIKGSHYFLESRDGVCATCVPVHRKEVLGRGITKSILEDVGIDTAAFEKLRKSKKYK